jgi:hypothetical protein
VVIVLRRHSRSQAAESAAIAPRPVIAVITIDATSIVNLILLIVVPLPHRSRCTARQSS